MLNPIQWQLSYWKVEQTAQGAREAGSPESQQVQAAEALATAVEDDQRVQAQDGSAFSGKVDRRRRREENGQKKKRCRYGENEGDSEDDNIERGFDLYI